MEITPLFQDTDNQVFIKSSNRVQPQPILLGNLNKAAFEQYIALQADPLLFNITANKDSVVLNEEVELSIFVSRPRFSPNLLFTFNELLAYRLKLLLPEGFVSTDATEFQGNFFDGQYTTHTFKVRGHFAAVGENTNFLLIRSQANEADEAVYIKKAELSLKVYEQNNEIFTAEEKAIGTCYEVVVSEAASYDCGMFVGQTTNYGYVFRNINGNYLEAACLNFSVNVPNGLEIISFRKERHGANQHNMLFMYELKATKIGNFNINANLNYSMGNFNLLGIYSVTSHYVTPEAIQYSAKNTSGNSITLSIDKSKYCEGGILTWHKEDGSNFHYLAEGNSINITRTGTNMGSGVYVAQCDRNCDQTQAHLNPERTLTDYLSFLDAPNMQSVGIATDKNTVCAGEVYQLSLTKNTCTSLVNWYLNNAATPFYVGTTPPAQYSVGSIQAKCSGNLTVVSNILTIAASSLAAAPNITATAEHITAGQSIVLTAHGCSGTAVWSGAEIEGKIGPSQTISQPGTYSAICQGSSCGNSPPGSINIGYAAISIAAANANCLMPGEQLTLTATGGCSYPAYFVWSNNDIGSTTVVNGPGYYWVNCRKDNVIVENQQAGITICARQADIPAIWANATTATSFKEVTLSGLGCPNAYIEWQYYEGSTLVIKSGNSIIVKGPNYYKARCNYAGTTNASPGPRVGLSIASEASSPISLIANKNTASDDELVTFNETGCNPGGLIKFFDANAQIKWYSPAQNWTATGAGTYKAECYASDGVPPTVASLTIAPKTGNTITIFSSKTKATAGEFISLWGTNCPAQYMVWKKIDGNNQTVETATGSPVYFTGPGTYQAKCDNGTNSPIASITIGIAAYDEAVVSQTAFTATSNQFINVVANCADGGYSVWRMPNGSYYWAIAGNPLLLKGPGTYYVRCKNNQNFSPVVIKATPPSSLYITTNKNSLALVGETGVLTANNCSYWQVNWQVGVKDPNTQSVNWANAINLGTGQTKTISGPGVYRATCTGDIINDGIPAMVVIEAKSALVPTYSTSSDRACTNERITFNASCPAGFLVQWKAIADGQENYWYANRDAIDNLGTNANAVNRYYWGNQLIDKNPGFYWVRCIKNDYTWLGNFSLAQIVIDKAFPDDFKATTNSPTASPLCSSESIQLNTNTLESPAYSWTWTGPGGFTSTLRNPILSNAAASQSGTYTLTARRIYSGGSCSVTSTVAVVIKDKVSIGTISANSPLQVHEKLNIIAPTTGATLWQWEGPNGFSSDQQNPAIFDVTHSTEGVYTLTASNTNGCSATATVNVVVNGCDVDIINSNSVNTNNYHNEIFRDINDNLVPIRLKADISINSNAYVVEWINQDGNIIGNNSEVVVNNPGVYYVKIQSERGFCSELINLLK